MAATVDPLPEKNRDREVLARQVLARAMQQGFQLVRHETDTGQVVWEWQGYRTRPQFLRRRLAIAWMAHRLDPTSKQP